MQLKLSPNAFMAKYALDPIQPMKECTLVSR